MRRTHALSVVIALLAAVTSSGCGSSEPTDVNGVYSINLTAGQNECMVQNWMMGATATGVTLTLVQDQMDGRHVTGKVDGPAGLLLAVLYGSNMFSGTVEGDDIVMDLLGRPGTEGMCMFTNIARVNASLNGDTLTGSIQYRFSITKSHADCGYRSTCITLHNFNGTRPPKP